MDQVSRPMLIALLATVALAGVWMVALRPKADAGGGTPTPAANAAPAPKAPGTAGLGRAVDHAKDAVAESKTSAARAEGAANTVGEGTAKAPAPGTAKTPASKPAAVSPNASASTPAADAVLRELAGGKAVVLLFAGDGADDAAAKRAVGAAKGSRVAVHVAPLSRLGDYRAILAGADVLSAPTVLVIGPDRKARVITGVTEAGEVRAAVADALHA
jgi:hypothetical protein